MSSQAETFTADPGFKAGDMLRQAADKCATALAGDLDRCLETAIRKQIGCDFKLSDLRGRLTSTRSIHDQIEDFYLDGKFLLRAWPPKMKMDGNRVTFSRNVLYDKAS